MKIDNNFVGPRPLYLVEVIDPFGFGHFFVERRDKDDALRYAENTWGPGLTATKVYLNSGKNAVLICEFEV